MKSLEESVLHCFLIPRGESSDDTVHLAVKNLDDLTREVVNSAETMRFLTSLAELGKDVARHQKKRSGKKWGGQTLSLILTGFLHGIRVGQEMEKQ